MTHELTLPQRAAVALGSAEHEQALIALAKESTDIVTVTNMDGREQAHRVGMTLRNARTTITKAGKAARDDATAFGKAVIAEEKRLVAIIEPEEERVMCLRDAFDAAEQARKDALIAAERARTDAIKKRILDLSNYAIIAHTASAAEMKRLISEFDQQHPPLAPADWYDGFEQDALAAWTSTCDRLTTMLIAAQNREAEALRQQQEREELAAAQEQLRLDQAAAALTLQKQREQIEAERVEAARLAKAEADRVARIRQMEDDKRAFDLKQAQDKIAAENEALRKERAELEAKQAELIIATAAAEPVLTPKEAKIDAMLAASEALEAALVAPEYRPSAHDLMLLVMETYNVKRDVAMLWLREANFNEEMA
jgi:hypothetical protein